MLAGAGYDRHRYAADLFEPAKARQACDGEGVLAPLLKALKTIQQAFAPELVIATAQNCVLPLAFPDARVVWMEQAPLPRRSGTARLSLDPCGHQHQSALQLGAGRFRDLPVANDSLGTIEALWGQMVAPPEHQQNTCTELLNAIEQHAAGAQVALLAPGLIQSLSPGLVPAGAAPLPAAP